MVISSCYFQVIYMIVVATVAYIFCVILGFWSYASGTENGDRFVDKSYRLIFHSMPRWLKALFRIFCGTRGVWCFTKTSDYLFNQNNQIVKYLYLLLINGFYWGFYTYGYPQIPNLFATCTLHKPIGFILYLLCLLALHKAAHSDPGVITASNVEAETKRYPYDEWIFQECKTCETCKTPKPARSKHCRLCNLCVSRFDHHCIWLGQCVGRKNMRWFLSFLVIHITICAYGMFLSGSIIAHEVVEKQLLSIKVYDPVTKTRVLASYFQVLQYLLQTNWTVVAVSFMTSIMLIVLSLFFGYHLNLIRKGETTNESAKWDLVNDVLAEQKHTGEVVNKYNNGFWSNLKDALNLGGNESGHEEAQPSGKTSKKRTNKKVN